MSGARRAPAIGEITLRKAARPTSTCRRKGLLHERASLPSLRAGGREVVAIDTEAGAEATAQATVEAMRRGAEVIHQAAFAATGWRDYAAFLLRPDERSESGPSPTRPTTLACDAER